MCGRRGVKRSALRAPQNRPPRSAPPGELCWMVWMVAAQAYELTSVERVRRSLRPRMVVAWVVRKDRTMPEPEPTSRRRGVGVVARGNWVRRKAVSEGWERVSRSRWESSEGS